MKEESQYLTHHIRAEYAEQQSKKRTPEIYMSDCKALYGRSIIDVMSERTYAHIKDLVCDHRSRRALLSGFAATMLLRGFEEGDPIRTAIGGAILGYYLKQTVTEE